VRTTPLPWCRGIMVKGRGQPTKNQASKRNSVVAGKAASATATASSSPFVNSSQKNKAKPQRQLLMSCNSYGVVITDDVKALQCDRCQTIESWKCADCLNIPVDMYDHLVADPNCSLRWFCAKCDKSGYGLGKQ